MIYYITDLITKYDYIVKYIENTVTVLWHTLLVINISEFRVCQLD